jgi:SAM-dependent methyltransferase
MTSVTQQFHDHYRANFLAYGATSEGVDWGAQVEASRLRLDNMLSIINGYSPGGTILDVGCGYGALADRVNDLGLNLEYTGIDLVKEMVVEAGLRHPHRRFIHGDFLSNSDIGTFDYIVCNGILTQKLSVTNLEMNEHAKRLITAMFASSRRGCAFNIMTTHVNFQVNNLYYRNPAELLGWCMSQLTRFVRLDHAYPLYEYTLYLYHQPNNSKLIAIDQQCTK